MSYRRKPSLILLVLALALIAVSVLSLLTGAIEVTISDWVLGADYTRQSVASVVLFDIRLPRMLLASLVGAGLGVSGAVIQGLFRNPLADPGLIGVSGGAALGAAYILVLGSQSLWLATIPINIMLPTAAFMGGLLATLLVMTFSWSARAGSVTAILLVGLAINTMATGGIGLLTALTDQDSLGNLTFWLLGSMAGADVNNVLIAAAVIVPAICLLLRDASNLDCLLLGESSARTLGVPVTALKLRLVFLSALVVGCAVAFTGMIGFIGLIVPNLLRFVVGPLHRWLLPASAIFGALLLVTADLLARTIWFPRELPIGVLTSLIGAPIFIFLIAVHRRKGLL